MEEIVYLQLKIAKHITPHKFFVVKNLNRNIILGRDWLKLNRACIYFDLGALRINNVSVALEEDKHISSIVRLDRWVELNSQHMHTCVGKTWNRSGNQDTYQTEQLTSEYLSNLFCISVAITRVTLNESQKVPLLIMNNTDQTIFLKQGCSVARLLK